MEGQFKVGAEDKPSSDPALIDQWRSRLPATNPPARASARWENADAGETRSIIIDWESADAPGDFFPFEKQAAEVQGATEIVRGQPGHIVLRKTLKKGDGPWPEKLSGLLVAKADSANPSATPVELTLAPPAPASKSEAPLRPGMLLVELLLAFTGGLILNVMPCVLPVIALKVLGFVNNSNQDPARVRRLGMVYGLGVLASFAVLAGLAIGAQKAGGLAGWGDAIRNPQVQVIMTVLMTLIALNLFGVFEVSMGGGTLGAAARAASQPGFAGAFFNGALATALATPCTAPFLGGALAFAFTQPAAVTMLVFLAAGAGLAFPFVLLCWEPRLLRALPKPGAWMERLKNALGFPMLATAVWLVWVAARNADDALWLELFLVIVALAAWIWGQFVQRGARGRVLAGAICVALLAAGYGGILEWTLHWRLPANAARDGIAWQVWSPEAVEKARSEGHPGAGGFHGAQLSNLPGQQSEQPGNRGDAGEIEGHWGRGLRGGFHLRGPANQGGIAAAQHVGRAVGSGLSQGDEPGGAGIADVALPGNRAQRFGVGRPLNFYFPAGAERLQ